MNLPEGPALTYKNATIITMAMLATAILVLLIDFQIKKDIVRQANDAADMLAKTRYTLAKISAVEVEYASGQDELYRGTDLASSADDHSVGSDGSGHLAHNDAGMETKSAPKPRSRRTANGGGKRTETVGAAGNASAGIPAEDIQVGA